MVSITYVANWQYNNFCFREVRECKGLSLCPIQCPRTTISSLFSEGARMAANFTLQKAEIYFGFLINQTLEVFLVENNNDNQAGKGFTVVCILVRMKSFPRFWRNHPYYRNRWYLIWRGCLFSLKWSIFHGNFMDWSLG